MNSVNLEDIRKNLPMFLGGLFLIYIAAADESLFNSILQSTVTDRATVVLATTVAASVPMFFAVGLIKKSILTRLDTIYYYEKLLESKIFWLAIIALMVTFVYLNIVVRSQTYFLVIAGCMGLIVFSVIYLTKNYRQGTP